MNLLITLIIGVAASRAAHSTFPGSRWMGTASLGMGGALAGGLIHSIESGSAHLSGFSSMNIFWSTLGAVVSLALGVVIRRAEHAQVPGRIENPES